MPFRIVKLAFSLYHKGLLEGTNVGPYTCTSVDDDHITIGCHKIPMWNIKLLEEKLNNINND